jgi:carbamoyl-phosphate synthase large subunit
VSKSKITIIRTAVGCPAAIGLIKELRKRKIKVIGTDCNPLSAGFYFCDKSYVVPKGNEPRFLKEILKICDIEKPKAIISGPEEEVLTLSRNKKIFEKRGVVVLVPDYKSAKICTDKIATYKFFKKENIPTPKIFNKDNVKFPIIIKPRFGRGSSQVFKIKNRNELEFYLKRIKNPILQEFINGIECTVDIFSDLEGKPLSIIPRVRIQVESGISMKSRTIYDEEIINWCKKIAKKLKLIGPSCIQCIKSKEGLKFTEINLRFGGGSILAIKADPTIILNLIRMIKGEKPIESKKLKEGLTMLRYYSEVYDENL